MLDYKQIYETEHVQNGLSYSEIRKKYNIPRGTWDYHVRKKLGLSCDQRKYKAVDNFFDTIDCEIKSYLLGFLYADGYLASDGRMGIRLANKDEEMIKMIQHFICPESPIEYTNNQNIHRLPQVSIRWKSERMYKRLEELGFCIDKTYNDSNIFTQIPNEFKYDFIRGFCDGDGSVRFEKIKRSMKCSVVFSNGTREILDDIIKFLPKETQPILYDEETYYSLRFETAYGSYYLASKLYKNANYYLQRKYNKALQIIKYRTNTELTGNRKTFPEV